MQMYVIVGCASCSGAVLDVTERGLNNENVFFYYFCFLFVHAQLQLPCFLLIIQSPYQNGNDGCVFFMPLNCSQRRTTRVAVADLNVF